MCLSRQDTEIRVKVQGVAFKEMFLQPAAFKRKLKLLESSRVYSSIFEKKKKNRQSPRETINRDYVTLRETLACEMRDYSAFAELIAESLWRRLPVGKTRIV